MAIMVLVVGWWQKLMYFCKYMNIVSQGSHIQRSNGDKRKGTFHTFWLDNQNTNCLHRQHCTTSLWHTVLVLLENKKNYFDITNHHQSWTQFSKDMSKHTQQQQLTTNKIANTYVCSSEWWWNENTLSKQNFAQTYSFVYHSLHWKAALVEI